MKGRAINGTVKLLGLILVFAMMLTGCSGDLNAPGVNEALQLLQKVDKLTVLCNTIEGTSKWDPTGSDIEQLRTWIGNLDYEEFDLLNVLDTVNPIESYTFEVNESEVDSIQYVIDENGNHYIYLKDKWNKVLNPSQPPVDTAEFIRAELLGLNDIDNMTIAELREVIKVLSQNPNTEQSLKLEQTLGISAEEIIDLLEGTEDNNALNFNGAEITEEDIKSTLKSIGLTDDMLDFSKYADFSFKDATTNISNQLTQALDASGPLGAFTRELFGDIWNNTKGELEHSYVRSYSLIKEAIGKKTNTPVEEVNADTVIKYIEDRLNQEGYEDEDGETIISDLLDTIYESMTPEEQQLMRMYNNFVDGVGTYDLTDIDTKTIFTELINGIRQELPPDQQRVLDMFTSVEGAIENYDYTSKQNTLTDDVLDSLKDYLTPEQQGVLRMFKEMT